MFNDNYRLPIHIRQHYNINTFIPFPLSRMYSARNISLRSTRSSSGHLRSLFPFFLLFTKVLWLPDKPFKTSARQHESVYLIFTSEGTEERKVTVDPSFPEFVAAALKVSLCERPRTRGFLIAHIFSPGI